MKYLFGAVYILVLITQLPHIWWAYASLESPDIPLAQWTALGAAVAFELSIGVFTYRIIKGSRRRWTKRGLAFFIVASIVANGYYYGWFPFVFDALMPAFATLALPLSLALFAEEFGAEVKREERQAKRTKTPTETTMDEPEPPIEQVNAFDCPICARSFRSQQALAGHMNGHKRRQEILDERT